MTEEDYNLHRRACENVFGEYGTTYVGRRMQKLLNSTYYTDWYVKTSKSPVPEDIRRKLSMLAGPHHKTILLAMEIKNATSK